MKSDFGDFCRSVPESGTHYAADALKPFVDSGELPGAISIFYKDGVQETCCLGWADREKQIPMSLDRTFMQCSQTKGFCGVCVAMLLEEGKVALDDPVSKYLPFFKDLKVAVKNADDTTTLVPAKTPITLRMAMNHTAGFPFEIPYKLEHGRPACSVQQSARTGAASPLLFEPGTRERYSNTGIDVGAAIIEVVTGRRWEDFLQERVLDPLEMPDSTFCPSDEQLSRAIAIYQLAPGEAPRRIAAYPGMPLPHNGPAIFAAPASGLWITAADQLKFYKMLMNRGVGENGRRILKEETVKKYLETSTRPKALGDYSLGLTAREVGVAFGHGGALGTSCTVNAKQKTLRLWVVQLREGPRPWDEVWFRAADRFFGADRKEADVGAYTNRTK